MGVPSRIHWYLIGSAHGSSVIALTFSALPTAVAPISLAVSFGIRVGVGVPVQLEVCEYSPLIDETLMVLGPPDVIDRTVCVAVASVFRVVLDSCTANVRGACAGAALAFDHFTVTSGPALDTDVIVGVAKVAAIHGRKAAMRP